MISAGFTADFHLRARHAVVALLLVLCAPAAAFAATCTVPDNGSGTVNLPPDGCGYVSPSDLHVMIDGLPPGTTIEIASEHSRFFNVNVIPGGSLGGEVEQFQSELHFVMTGTGALAGFSRVLTIPAACETHVGPRTPGDAVQSFDTEMVQLQGMLPPGDPDFDLLRVSAGSGNGLPSPGHTTLTQLPTGNWNVDSFFDIAYEIEFVGAPGGALDGLAGTTTGTLRMGTGAPVPAPSVCTAPNNGEGSVDLPAVPCTYVSPTTFDIQVDGLPPGTVIQARPKHGNVHGVSRTPGGPLGGEGQQFQSVLHLDLEGLGGLSGFGRTVDVPLQCLTASGPRVPGDPVQEFDTEMVQLQGMLPPGDPDFAQLQVVAGTGFGLPSPGHTTLTLRSDGRFNVDSFFDIVYDITFQGAPGGALAGLTGSATGTLRMQSGQAVPPPVPPCTVVDNGTGTVDLPPPGCGYVSPDDLHMMIDGLPPGTEIHVAAEHNRFFNVVTQPGGTLGGEKETFDSNLQMFLTGTGDLATFARTLNLQVQCETHVAAHEVGHNIQSFDTDMFRLQGEIFGDPDFDLLRITAGTGNGLPSPGHTTLTRAPGGSDFNVDSFFDITYQIEYVGAPGGALSGMSGTTTGTIRMQAGQPTLVDVPAQRPLERDVRLTNSPNPFNPGTVLQYRLPSPARVRISVYDVAGARVRGLLDARMAAGPHAMMWDGRDDAGRRLGSGTYFVKLEVDGRVIASRKTILVR